MRTYIILSSVAAVLASGPDYGIMVMFVNREGVHPTTQSTELHPVFSNGRTTEELLEWFRLDEATFMEEAREPASVAHEAIMKNEVVGRELREYVSALARRGLTPDQITADLLKKHYKSLQSKTVLQKMAAEEDAEDDD
jgi:hypothetical protein